LSHEKKATQDVPGGPCGQPLFSPAEWAQIVLNLKLSPRQSQVVALLIGGMSDQEIAKSLGMAVRTVREHLTRAFRLLDVRDRVQLIVCVFSVFRQCDDGGHQRSK
jgi:DNA-binding NarL/FixJ family response regulator